MILFLLFISISGNIIASENKLLQKKKDMKSDVKNQIKEIFDEELAYKIIANSIILENEFKKIKNQDLNIAFIEDFIKKNLIKVNVKEENLLEEALSKYDFTTLNDIIIDTKEFSNGEISLLANGYIIVQ